MNIEALASNLTSAKNHELEAYFRNVMAHLDRNGVSYTTKVVTHQVTLSIPIVIEGTNTMEDIMGGFST